MSTATAPDSAAKQSCTTQHFLLRRVHSLTGLVFGGYLVVHLMINATLAQVGDVYQEQVNKLYSLPFLMGIEWALIFLPIIFHTIYGIWITIKGQPNVNHYGYHRNWQYTLQRMSAMVIVLFLVFHVLGLKYHLFGTSLSFDHHNATASVHRHMMTSVLIPYVIYPIGILASCYHLANGFWGAPSPGGWRSARAPSVAGVMPVRYFLSSRWYSDLLPFITRSILIRSARRFPCTMPCRFKVDETTR